MDLEQSLAPHPQINSKVVKDLKLRPGSKKVLQENPGRILFDINHSNIFLDWAPSVMEIKTKINQWGLNKLKCVGTAKETINRKEQQSTGWKKIFLNEAMDKTIISKIYKWSNSMTERQDDPIKKCTEDPSRYFSKEDI